MKILKPDLIDSLDAEMAELVLLAHRSDEILGGTMSALRSNAIEALNAFRFFAYAIEARAKK